MRRSERMRGPPKDPYAADFTGKLWSRTHEKTASNEKNPKAIKVTIGSMQTMDVNDIRPGNLSNTSSDSDEGKCNQNVDIQSRLDTPTQENHELKEQMERIMCNNKGDMQSRMDLLTKENQELKEQMGRIIQQLTNPNSDGRNKSSMHGKGKEEEARGSERGSHMLRKSYAEVMASNEGLYERMKLNFVPPANINGIKGVEYSVEEVESEVLQWENAIVTYVLGSKPPFHVMKGFLERIWRKFGAFKLSLLKSDLFGGLFLQEASRVPHTVSFVPSKATVCQVVSEPRLSQKTVALAKRIVWDSLLRKTMANTKERIDALEAQVQRIVKCDEDAPGILKQISLRLDALEVNVEATDNARYAETMDWEGNDMFAVDRLFFFMEGLKPWARTELNRRLVNNLNEAIIAAESLSDYNSEPQRPPQRGNPNRSNGGKKPGGQEPNQSWGSKSSWASNSSTLQKSGVGFKAKPDASTSGEVKKPAFRGCFLCQGPHVIANCPQRQMMNAFFDNMGQVQRGEQSGSQSRHPPTEEQTDTQDYEVEDAVGAFPQWCNAVTTQVRNPEESSTGEKLKDMPPKKKSDVPGKGLMYVDIKVNGKAIRAMVDTGATHNYISSTEVERLGLTLEKGCGRVKAINSAAQPVAGIARSVLIKVGPYEGRTNFSVVIMDEFKLILGLEFLRDTKTTVMPCTNSLAMLGSKPCVIPTVSPRAGERSISALQLKKGLKRDETTYLAMLRWDEIEEVSGPLPKEVKVILNDFEDELLAEFNFMLEYRAGSTNSVANALSRRAELNQVALMAMNAIVRADSRVAINIGQKIKKALTRDPVAQQLLKLIESGKTRQFWQEDGLLMTKGRRYWGMPQDIVSDRDSRFTGNFWTELFKLFGSQLSMSSSYHPESDGQMERFNSMLEEYLRHFVSATQKNWVKLLDVAQLCFNSRKSSSTGKSAFEIVNGQQPLLPHTVNVPNAGKSPRAISFSEEWRQNIDLAHSYLEKAARRMKKHADKNRRSQEFNVGDKVMVKLLPQDRKFLRGRDSRLLQKYERSLTIVKKIGKMAYKVDPPNWWSRQLHPVFHVSMLKPFYEDTADPSRGQIRRPGLKPKAAGKRVAEAILNDRVITASRKRHQEYLVKWQGYMDEENTWERAADLSAYTDKIEAYHMQKLTRTSTALVGENVTGCPLHPPSTAPPRPSCTAPRAHPTRAHAPSQVLQVSHPCARQAQRPRAQL
ncbi:hypothetical protein RJ640_014983 [Escallonia rubra]|uniref:Chromo domain-containing protein n=1 Tax=Escallonia rubra TaxID=112253 RepID=A0AA88QNJ8_9ASTE|nr:hypothetical protein RJ640_014983 [Escallonia rubra]